MKAIGNYESLSAENVKSLVHVDVPLLQPRGRDLLIKIKAVSVNPVDTKIRIRTVGLLEEPQILGWDASGIVEAVGEDVTFFKTGDEVFYAGDITRPGCNSEFQLIDERIVGLKPSKLSFKEAAAMPLTTITAWESLFDHLGVSKNSIENTNKSILIIGGAGGVGSIAIQLAKKIAGLKVIATASRPETIEWCFKMGADFIVNHYNSFREEFDKTAIENVDYILCLNSTEKHIENMESVIKPLGKICLIVETKNNEPVNLNCFQSKSVGICWELMFTRSKYKTPDMVEQHKLLNETSKLLDSGILETTLTEDFGRLTPENLRKAHSKLESGTMIGKLVLGGIDGGMNV